MFIAALIIYFLLGLLIGPLWPLDFLSGKAGLLGFIIGVAWIALLIGGFTS
jgi:hypothetical protein